MKTLIMLGGGAHCAVALEAASLSGQRVFGILDQSSPAKSIIGTFPVLGGDEFLQTTAARSHVYHIAVTNPALRSRLHSLLDGFGLCVVSVAHPSAVISQSAIIEAGCFLGPGCIVNPGAFLDKGVVVNSRALIEHDCKVGQDSHIAPAATLAGNVRCGTRVFVGTGATILPNLCIGDDAVIGAGAVILSSVDPGTTMVGNPARPTINV